MGLVEAGVGLIPGGGGCKELVRRIVSPAMRGGSIDPVPALRRVLETIGQAKVSTSAAEARDLGYLGEHDRIVLGRDRLLTEAKRMALDLAEAGYQPPLPGKTCYAAGQGALASLLIGIHQYRAGGFISVHDATIVPRLAAVLCGGDLSAPAMGGRGILPPPRTRGVPAPPARTTRRRSASAHMLETGKPLRN